MIVCLHVHSHEWELDLPLCGASFEAGTDFTDFLVRQSIVPSAILAAANKMATTMIAIATIIPVTFAAFLFASC